jgi:membrane-bound serine protease (ClpP class)
MISPALLISLFSLTATIGDSVTVAESSATTSPAVKPAAVTVYVIPVTGDVEPAMAAFIGRSVREALADPDALVVLEMDTFGGRVDAAFQIVDTLLQFPGERVVAYVKNKAISAGALIALACGDLYMRPGTTIGDCAPIMYSKEGGPTMLGEKFQSPLRAKFRALAKRNGFPEALAEAMVSDDIIVYKLETASGVQFVDSIGYADMDSVARAAVARKSTVVKRGDLLTVDAEEAAELGFSKGTVATVEELARILKGAGAVVKHTEQNWSETFARFLTKIAPILMLIGFAGIYLEVKTPGSIWPGLIGGLCLALAFFGEYMVGLANYTELLLLVAGAVLILVEVFVFPGTGLFAIAGIVVIAAGMILSMQSFVIPAPDMPWQKVEITGNILRVLGGAAGGLVVSLAMVRYVLPHLGPVVDGPYLQATMSQSHVDADSTATLKVGQEGVAQKPLRPAGMVLVGGQVHDAQTEGDFIETGAAVVVIRIEGNHVFVARKGNA